MKKLQNGSDIRGIAIAGVDGEDINLDMGEAIFLSLGFADWLSKKCNKSFDNLKIAVGMDSRISGEKLKSYLIDTFCSLGISVLDCGLASTPAMFMSTVFDMTNCDGSIMITASHLPYNRNGFKYFTKDGGLDKADISDIIAFAENISDGHIWPFDVSLENISMAVSTEKHLQESLHNANFETFDLITFYSLHLQRIIKDALLDNKNGKPLQGLKIVVDAGNGAGGFYAKKVLEPLGADTTGSQFLEPDGMFPNHIPNPENKEAMASVCDAVKANGADFGLIFDTDVDRVSAVDKNGNPISRNAIVALAASLIADEHPDSIVVTDSVTSDHLTTFLQEDLHLKHLRFKRGYKNVINKAIELNADGSDCQLAIETSGHAAFKENYFLDDGAYLATKIVIKAAQLKALKESPDNNNNDDDGAAGHGADGGAGGSTDTDSCSIDSLIASLKQPLESKEFRMKILCDDFATYGADILKKLQSHIKDCEAKQFGVLLAMPNYEGVRMSFDKSFGDGWALLRMSLHDPLMPLNIESDSPEGCRKISAFLYDFLSQFKDLDCSLLK